MGGVFDGILLKLIENYITGVSGGGGGDGGGGATGPSGFFGAAGPLLLPETK